MTGKAWQGQNVGGPVPSTEDQEAGSKTGTYDLPSPRPYLLNVPQPLKIVPHVVKT